MAWEISVKNYDSSYIAVYNDLAIHELTRQFAGRIV